MNSSAPQHFVSTNKIIRNSNTIYYKSEFVLVLSGGQNPFKTHGIIWRHMTIDMTSLPQSGCFRCILQSEK